MKKVLSYLKPYKKAVFLSIFFATLIALGTLLLPDFMSQLIGNGIQAEYSELIDGQWVVLVDETCEISATCTVEQISDFSVILKYSAMMLGVTLASSLASIGLMYYSSFVGTKVSQDLRSDLYKKVTTLSISEIGKFGTSTLITRATNDIRQIQNFLLMSLRMIVRIPVMMVGGVIFAVAKSVNLSGAVAVAVPVLAVFIGVVFVFAIPLFKMQQKKVDRLTLVTRESINGVRVIRAFGQGDTEVERFDEANHDLTNLQFRIGRIMAFLNPVINVIFNISMVGIVFIGYMMVMGGGIVDYSGIANISAVIQYASQIMFSILMLTMTFIMYPRAQVSANRLKEVLETETSIEDAKSDEYDNYNFKGSIKFDNVCFKFPEADQNILEDISFEAKPGETVAIIGSTGSGKSTIVNLIPRLFDITCGDLTIDGVSLRDIKLKKLRSLIGFVTQRAQLFTGTIKENLTFGKTDATDAEIDKACEIAQAKEFIDSLDDRYDHVVEQGGVNFSGGQKQRLSIARGLVRRPKIYVFDDSFSALDFKTDAKLRQAMKKEVNDATVLIVAQRIGTIMDADKIIVLQEGRIVGYGKHRDLLKNCDVYREIALSQMDEEELK